jgi:predicted DNA-binding protein with PD1-like motif
VFVVQVGKGEEVLATITREVEARGVTQASVTLIGAVQTYCVSVMPKGDPLADILTEYDQPAELTGTGEVVDGKPHLHVSMGVEDGTVTGHLHWARVQDWFVRAYVTPVS